MKQLILISEMHIDVVTTSSLPGSSIDKKNHRIKVAPVSHIPSSSMLEEMEEEKVLPSVV